MSELREIVLRKYDSEFNKSYLAFDEYVTSKIIENGGCYTMDKLSYYYYCNECNENNSAIQYIKRTKRFTKTILYDLSRIYAIDDTIIGFRVDYERIRYIGKPYSPRTCLLYCIKRFCKEHEDCIVSSDRDKNELYFRIKD